MKRVRSAKVSDTTRSFDERIIEIMAKGVSTDWQDSTTFAKDHWRYLANDALEAIREAGFEIVPREPTEAMCEAGATAFISYMPASSEVTLDADAAWRAMLEASRR